MKHQNQTSFITDDQAEHMGADMAIQFMLMMLFQLVSEMADDPRGFHLDVHKELTNLVATYKLPPCLPPRISMPIWGKPLERETPVIPK